MRKGYCVFSVVLLFFLFSCDEGMILSPDPVDGSAISTLSNGAILSSKGEIPVHLDILEQYNDKILLYELFDSQGVLVGTTEVSGDDLKELLPLKMTEDMEKGTYRLKLTLQNGQEIQAQKELTFFYSPVRPHITGLQSFPLVLLSGAQALLSIDIPPQDEDPWIRWTLEEDVIASGFYSDLGDRITITAPSLEGIYTVRVELFPEAPEEGLSWDFSSPVYEESLLYVGNEISLGDYDLNNPDSYYCLYHFQGEYEDRSSLGRVGKLIPWGEPVLDTSQGLFGYSLEDLRGFSSEKWPLPVEKGILQPLSLVMVASFPKDVGTSVFFETRTEDQNFLIQWGTNGKDQTVMKLRKGNLVNDIVLGPLPDPEGYPLFTLSLVPGQDKMKVLYYQGEKLLSVNTLPWNEEKIIPEGNFAIGGGEGNSAVLDEFGIYFNDSQKRPAILSDMFRERMEESFRGALLYAEGFDGLYLSDEANISGDYAIGESMLSLSGESLYYVPVSHLLEDSLTGFISARGRGVLQFMKRTGEDLTILTEMGLSSSGKFALEWDEEKNTLTFNGTVFLGENPFGEDEYLIGIKNPGDAPLLLDSLIVLKSGIDLSADSLKGELVFRQRGSSDPEKKESESS